MKQDAEASSSSWHAYCIDQNLPKTVQEGQGKVEQLIQVSGEGARQLFSQDQDCRSHAEGLFLAGQLEEARRVLEEECERDAATLSDLAVVLHQLGESGRAKEVLREALEMEPGHPDALYNLGQIALSLGDRACALTHFAQGLAGARESNGADFIEGINKTLSGWTGSEPDGQLVRLMEELEARDDEANLQAFAAILLKHVRLAPAVRAISKLAYMSPGDAGIRDALLQTLELLRNETAARSMAAPGTARPTCFDRERELNPNRTGFLKYVPEEMVEKKTGLKVLFVSDFEIAGNQARLMHLLNHHTTHAARNFVANRDYLNFGHDLLLTDDGALEELAKELIPQADFFHFVRGVPELPGIDWKAYLSPANCLIDYFGSDIRGRNKDLAEAHARTGIMGLNKYDWSMYRGAEGLPYHVGVMFDYERIWREADLSWLQTGRKQRKVVIGHAPTNPAAKNTQHILPVLEKVRREQSVKGVDIEIRLIMGLSNAQAVEAKAGCDIFIDQLRREGEVGATGGIPAQNSFEALALGKVTITSLDDFYLTFHPVHPFFAATCETLGDCLNRIFSDPKAVARRLALRRPYFEAHLSPNVVLRKYLHFYSLISRGNRMALPGDSFTQPLGEAFGAGV